MKKVISLVLALAMVLALGVCAMASVNVDNGSQSVDAEYQAGTVSDTGAIYSVQIEWTSFQNLKYTQGNTTYRWDAVNSKYVVDSTTESEWSDGSFEVKITNKSNAAINASAAYTDTADDGLTTEMTWTKQTDTCDSAAKNITNYQGTGTPTTCTLSGTVEVTEGTIDAKVTGVGTISITIAKVVG